MKRGLLAKLWRGQQIGGALINFSNGVKKGDKPRPAAWSAALQLVNAFDVDIWPSLISLSSESSIQ